MFNYPNQQNSHVALSALARLSLHGGSWKVNVKLPLELRISHPMLFLAAILPRGLRLISCPLSGPTLPLGSRCSKP